MKIKLLIFAIIALMSYGAINLFITPASDLVVSDANRATLNGGNAEYIVATSASKVSHFPLFFFFNVISASIIFYPRKTK